MNNNYWIRTRTGKKFYPYAPSTDMVDIRDIAHSLALQCRFAGQCPWFYSIAEHSIQVVNAMELHPGMRPYALNGLLHDAAEAYICDLPKPIKAGLDEYRDLERLVEDVIAQKFDIELDRPEVKAADRSVLKMEYERFFSSEHFVEAFGHEAKMQYKRSHYLGLFPEIAEIEFLNTFNRLVR
jgi:uncharacterized protein